MVAVKVCGIRTREAAIQAASSGADLIGLIFVPKSKRQVTVAEATEIIQAIHATSSEHPRTKLPSREVHLPISNPSLWFAQWSRELEIIRNQTHRPLVVGVFSNQSSQEINQIASQVGLDLIQLHGDEPDQLCDELALPVIRAVHVGENETASGILGKISAGHYAFVLLDSKVTGFAQQGGSGISFDWTLAAEISSNFPVLVAGGLTPGNVQEAIEKTKAWAVDVSSGVETDGAKDISKISIFVHNAKSLNKLPSF